MKKALYFFLCLILVTSVFAQKKKKKSFGISFKGFVKTDVMLDTRQTVAAREGHFLLYPAAELNDPDNEDVNAKANLNMLSIQSRLTGTITAPDFLGAKTTGVLEGAFFGHSNADVNGFRLRHAFLKLDWKKSQLLVGQYWHPMFITEVFPGVVSFNTGVPFQPFSRNPQIKYTIKTNKVNIAITAASQRDFTSTGPSGAGSTYLRNALIPILDLNIKYMDEGTVLGVGGNFKSLMPRTVTSMGYDTDEKVSSIAAMAFAKFTIKNTVLKLEGIYGQNMYDLLMLGGYAVKSIEAVKGVEEYTNTNTMSAWMDLSFGKKVMFGLFAGYTKNMGTDDDNIGIYYSRGNNIESVMRVSPRIIYHVGQTRFAGEIDYTSAAYGAVNSKGEVEDTTNVANLRVLLAAYLFF